MVITGPWDLGGFPDVNYGVVFMPAFAAGGSHETIAGPDNWVIVDNGPARVDAAWTFLSFMTSPDQVLQDSLDTSHMPTRSSVAQMPEFAEFFTKYPGTQVFVDNLNNVLKAGRRSRKPADARRSARGCRGIRAMSAQDADPALPTGNGFLAIPPDPRGTRGDVSACGS
jgi:ABC-type glycerol-3-phosphate transport system substrate-binding protein